MLERNKIMKEYSLQKDTLKPVLLKALPFSFILLLFPWILYFIITSSVNEDMLLGFIKLLCGLLFIYTLIRESIKIYKIRRDWLSFKILITEDSIQKKQYKTMDIVIPINQIVKIVQIADGISIQSEYENKFIYIPKDIENYEEVLCKLNALKPIVVSPLTSVRTPSDYALRQNARHGSALKRLSLGIAVGLGILIVLFFVDNDPIILGGYG